jgi:type I restriction enzyme S subunit
MKFLFNERAQKGFASEPLLAATQSKGVVRKEDYGLRTVTAVTGLENLKLVDVGDFVISLRSFQGGIEVSHARGIISPAYTVLRASSDFEPRYYKTYFKSAEFINSLTLFVTGIREGQNIDYERLSRAFMPLPPPDEQAAIVQFLHWATGRLERAIRAKRKVIALLNERKQAIIYRAVTRGLDSDVSLKPSGIPWLGDIPKHWDVRRLSAVAKFRSGKAHEKFVDNAGGHVCVTARFVSTEGKSRKFCTKNVCAATKGDVLMVMSDLPNGRALARAYLVRDKSSYAVNQRVCALTAHSIDPRLLAYWSNRNWHLLRNDDGLNQTHLSNYDYKTMPVLLPPSEEQTRIADWLDEATSHLDVTTDRLGRECDLLAEYRTRLVADVVAGKLDVREAAARLPDETPLDSVEVDAELGDETEVADEEAAT